MSAPLHLVIDAAEYYSGLSYEDRIRVNLATTGMVPFQQYPKWKPLDTHPWNKRGYYYSTLPQHTRPGIAVIASRVAPFAVVPAFTALATASFPHVSGPMYQSSMSGQVGIGSAGQSLIYEPGSLQQTSSSVWQEFKASMLNPFNW